MRHICPILTHKCICRSCGSSRGKQAWVLHHQAPRLLTPCVPLSLEGKPMLRVGGGRTQLKGRLANAIFTMWGNKNRFLSLRKGERAGRESNCCCTVGDNRAVPRVGRKPESIHGRTQQVSIFLPYSSPVSPPLCPQAHQWALSASCSDENPCYRLHSL